MGIGLLDILCILLLTAGLISFAGASLGLLRFPDFYTRMHAAGKGDTLSTILIMAGAGLYEFNRWDPEHGTTFIVILTVVKIMGIGVFIMITSPTSTHALMQAGYDDNIEPVGERDEIFLEMPALSSEQKPELQPKKKAARRLKD